MMTDTDDLSAHDLRTVACVPLNPFRRGFEDAAYQHIYDNPYPISSDDFWRYSAGHRDGTATMRDNRSAA